jgi:nickel/cobalt transporter (NiCoT) family protein
MGQSSVREVEAGRPHAHAWLTTAGRAAQPFRTRVRAAFATIALLHVVGLALLAYGVLSGAAGAVTVGVAAFAYVRGLAHSFDFDHISMIDNSTRKFVSEGRAPASVGLAFSMGHSSVVVATGVLVVAGAGFVRGALDDGSRPAQVLGVVGLSVSGLYLLLVAVANLATFGQAVRLRRALRADAGLVVPPAALSPQGPAARIMTAPLRRVRHPRHVFVIGLLFSLGFDTSSQIGLLMVTAGAALAGAPAVSLLCLPFLFAAAMTLGDTSNGLMMLRLYRSAEQDARRKIDYNLLITGVSILSGLLVAAIALSTLLTELLGWRVGLVETLAGVDTEHAGYLLAGFFALVGSAAVLLWRRTGPRPG